MDLYNADTAHAWEKRLLEEWYKIYAKLRDDHEIVLPTPAFEIVDKKWGQYSNRNGNPTIVISRHLFNNFGWGAVVHVLKHEIAHMIVDVAWHMQDLKPHGEAFKRACRILDVDPSRCSSIEQLLSEDSRLSQKEKMVTKVKKVMALTTSSAQGEAENALRKAEELMLKYNIESLEEGHDRDEYLFRPVGPIWGRVPNYARDLANTIAEFYFVKHILCYAGPRGRYFEFFGTKENLDIAEYIFCGLLRQGEKLWKEYSAEIKAKYGRVRGIASKASFLEGVYSGYRAKLREQERDRTKKNRSVAPEEALIWTGDPLLTEMYHEAYPNLVHYNYQRTAHGGGRLAGYDKGKDMSMNPGITTGSAGNRGRLLNS